MDAGVEDRAAGTTIGVSRAPLWEVARAEVFARGKAQVRVGMPMCLRKWSRGERG